MPDQRNAKECSLRNVGGKAKLGAFVEAVARGVETELIELLRELSGELPYQRYVDSRRRCCFPEGIIMTRREYESWRAKLREQRPPEARC